MSIKKYEGGSYAKPRFIFFGLMTCLIVCEIILSSSSNKAISSEPPHSPNKSPKRMCLFHGSFYMVETGLVP